MKAIQDVAAERAFYEELFQRNPDNEHILDGYEELHRLAFQDAPAGSVVLDLGCGTGAHAVRMASAGFDVVAVDLTRQGVRATRERFRNAGLEGAFVVANAEALPFRDQAFPVTWTSLLLHHFLRLDGLVPELSRVTGDRLIAFEPNAGNLLTWFAMNVVNRFWGLSIMSRNQKALRVGAVTKLFNRVGLRRDRLHYVDRTWSDGLSFVRRAYRVLTRALPLRFRANKFLVVFRKERA